MSPEGRQGSESYFRIEARLVEALARSKIHAERPVDEHGREHKTGIIELSTYDPGTPGRGGKHRHPSVDQFPGSSEMRRREAEIEVPKGAVEIRGHQSNHGTPIGRPAVDGRG